MFTKAAHNLNDPAHRGHSNQVITTNGITASRVWVPEMPLLETVKNQLIDICENHSRERCGFISSEWEVYDVPNTHKQPYRNFYMSPEDADPVLDEIYKNRQEVVIAQWHTHPNNVTWPTPRDIRGWPDQRLGWRYLIVTHNEIIEWELVDES